MTLSVAQYIADRLAVWGVSHIFTLTGGGAMFLNDAFGHHPRLQPVYQHHEQACAMAAEGYARVAGIPGVAVVTTGPGGINALNGVFGAYTDSIPLLVLSGQVKRATCLATTPVPGLRQLGDQEAEIVPMAATITKYAAVLRDPAQVAVELEKAWAIAQSGRPGPVWLDIPLDIQSAPIDPESLEHLTPAWSQSGPQPLDAASLSPLVEELASRLATAKRPVLMGGSGVRIGGAIPAFMALAEQAGIPVVTAWTHDLIPSDHPLFCGRPGTIGTRQGNFVVQNADLLIVIGSRLNIRQISYNWTCFADRAHVVQVDIDPAELHKPTFRAQQSVHAEAGLFCQALREAMVRSRHDPVTYADWVAWCRERGRKYPVVQEHHRDATRPLNIYHFVDRLFDCLDREDVIVTGNATACIVTSQVARLQDGMRLISNSGSASMGHDLPCAIGSYYGAIRQRGQQRRIICLAGDGSLMLNVQELQTVVSFNIPIKIVVLDNGGYLSIRSTQQNFFGRLAGESPHTGVKFPDFVKLAFAFGLPATRLEGLLSERGLSDFLAAPGPGLLHVVLDPSQGFEPRMSSRQLPDGTIVSPRLEDMYPFLDPDELASNLFAAEASC
ncbi:MAG: thiamine pyrophosphate-binding protein [Magnetococcales bacterium]|nr:thiamine pyrophosphate-binding protein [Magnetococcales bacterium]